MFIPPILKIYKEQRMKSAAHPSLKFVDTDSVVNQIDSQRIASLFFYRVRELTIDSV